MQWVLLALGLVGCALFCWYVLREDRRSMRAHHARREHLRLVSRGDATEGEGADGAVDTGGEPAREAA